MGDGIYDGLVMEHVTYSVAPANAVDFAKQNANYVTALCGGHGAVFEACLHICEKFLGLNVNDILNDLRGRVDG